MRDDDDRQLLEAARAGDKRALEALLERHQAQIYRFGMKLCRDPEDAKEVLQETLLGMARGISDFRGASSLSSWLYVIARSHCIKKRRGSKATAIGEPLDTTGDSEATRVVDGAPTPDEHLGSKDLAEALDRALATLPPMYREILILRDMEELSAAEVAEVLAISVQAVKSRLHRARVMLRERLAGVLDASPTSPTSPTSPEATDHDKGCPDVLNLFSRYLEDEISAEVCAQMEQHLEGCERCRSACDSLKRTLALCRVSGEAVEVPASLQDAVKVAMRDFLADP